jgi:hypothetical protein
LAADVRKPDLPQEFRTIDYVRDWLPIRREPRRVPEPRMVSFARRGEGDHRNVAAALQRSAPAFEPRFISRPTSSWREEQDQRPVRQRAGTLRYMGPPRPGPLRNRPFGDKCSQQGEPSQANRGPKNLSRLSRCASCVPSMAGPNTIKPRPRPRLKVPMRDLEGPIRSLRAEHLPRLRRRVGRLSDQFRTFQVCLKDLPFARW